MVAIPSVLSSSLVLLLVLFTPAVLARARGKNNDVSSCFASAGIAFRTNRFHQAPPISRWQQTASGLTTNPPALEFGSELSASKRRNHHYRGLGELGEFNQQTAKKWPSLRLLQRMKKVAKVTSLGLLHFTALRLRPGSAAAAAGNADAAPPASQARPASVVRMVDDDQRVVHCSIKPGAIRSEDGTFVSPEVGETGTVMHDFGSKAGEATADAADAIVSPKKRSRKERRALRRQQRQKEKQWEDYGDEDEDDDEDFASGDGNLLSDGDAAAGSAPAPGMGAPGASQGGYMSRPPGVTGISDKAKSNIQAKVILIAGGGYAVSCFGYEGWQWNKEQKKVETSIEILGEQAKELGMKLETNATATDEDIADELRNITDASENGEEDEESDKNSDNDDDDNDEPEPPRRQPRKPIRPTPDDDNDDDYGGGMGGGGSGLPSADDLNRLNNLFKKS